MENRIKYGDFTWVEKPSGYYQSTIRCADGLRKNWLHQFVYETEYGSIPQGYDVHHKDEDKSNNRPDNLELLSRKEHQEEHYEQNVKNGHVLSKYVEENFEEVQALAKLGKEGKYVGRAKRKKLPNKPILCAHCGEEFVPHKKARKDTKFCSTSCSGKWHKRFGISDRECKDCGTVFTPVTKASTTCEKCRLENRVRGSNKVVNKVCKVCGCIFEGNSRHKYCGDKCKRAEENRLCREARSNKKNLGVSSGDNI